MKTHEDFDAFLSEAKKSDAYWVEKAKLDFALKLEKQRRNAAMNYSAIAKKIATSGAYITKIFRGDSNVTLDTMVKLVRATGGELQIEIMDNTSAAKQAPAEPIKVAVSPVRVENARQAQYVWDVRGYNAHANAIHTNTSSVKTLQAANEGLLERAA